MLWVSQSKLLIILYSLPAVPKSTKKVRFHKNYQAFICSKLTIKALEKDMRHPSRQLLVQS